MPARQRWCGLARVMSRPSRRDRAGIGRKPAGDQVEQRGLAGAVRPDDAERLALARPRDRYLSAATTEPKLLRNP